MPSAVWAQGVLENPSVDSAQSGIGTISGWYCNASKIEVVIDSTLTVQAAYGTTRVDTQGSCGDTNNGFGLLVNWNNLAPGPHTVRVLADGKDIGQARVTVATFGTNFLRGQSGTFTLTFAGKNLLIEWNEALQNFVIAQVTDRGASGGVGSADDADLQALLGRWAFTYRILIIFTDVFTLNDIRTVNGNRVIAGTNVVGAPVIVARTKDLVPSSTLPYKFFLLNVGIILCGYYNFDQVGPNGLTGVYAFSRIVGGACGPVSSNIYDLTGTRLNALVFEPYGVNQESEKLRMSHGAVRGPLQEAFDELGRATMELE